MCAICISQVFAILILLTEAVESNSCVEPGPARAVFRVDVPNPTADKPQSKLWYAQDSWWACLPTQNGNQIFRRSAAGWIRSDEPESPLRGLHGHADVDADQDSVRVVLVAADAFTVAVMRYDEQQSGYVRAAPPTTWPTPADGAIETATITNDQAGRLWVAYDAGQSVWVRASSGPSGVRWTDPIRLGRGISDDDICAIARVRGGVAVVWSNQNSDSVLCRIHRDSSAPEIWDQTEIIAQGNRTADDHLNCAATEDGTLFVATKTSLDTPNQPLLLLRERLPDGQWRSHAYANLEPNAEPSRPIVLVSHSSKRLVLFHTLYGAGVEQPGCNSIIGLMCPYPDPDLHCERLEFIPPTAKLNNVTGCKSSLPDHVPAVILVSDRDGNVYEAAFDLRTTVREWSGVKTYEPRP